MKPCRVILSWPSPELFPNRSNGKHWSVRQSAKAASRTEAMFRAIGGNIGDTSIDHGVKIIVAPPDHRRRDVDGILAALKPSLDGIAEVLRIDDVHFNPIEIIRVEPVERGCVTVIIEDSIPF